MMKDNKVKQVIDIGFDDGQTDIDQSRVPFTRSVVDVQKKFGPHCFMKIVCSCWHVKCVQLFWIQLWESPSRLDTSSRAGLLNLPKSYLTSVKSCSYLHQPAGVAHSLVLIIPTSTPPLHQTSTDTNIHIRFSHRQWM